MFLVPKIDGVLIGKGALPRLVTGLAGSSIFGSHRHRSLPQPRLPRLPRLPPFSTDIRAGLWIHIDIVSPVKANFDNDSQHVELERERYVQRASA